MNISTLKSIIRKRETHFHIAFWLFYFSSINAHWRTDWFDRSLRPETVSQFSILFFPVMLYLNAFWLIPNFLRARKWIQYIVVTGLVLFGFEFIRCSLHVVFHPTDEILGKAFITEFNSYDNLIFGRLNPAFLCLQFSFAYRLSRDWIEQFWQTKDSSEETEIEITSLPANRMHKRYKTSYFIKKKNGLQMLATEDIVYFKAQGDFVLAMDKNRRKHIINSTLVKIEEEMDPSSFFKINRSEILNKTYVVNYESYIKNRLKIALKSYEDTLYTSNSRTPEFRKWLQG
ncbi:MAG: LytTR family DNA-binding domain-containing protein [Bacteroidota bacterium]